MTLRPHEFAFAHAAQVIEGLGVWANARHKWRRARVIAVRGGRAVVAFRLATSPRVVCQSLPVSSLMRAEWEPPARMRLWTSTPTIDEARAVLAAMRTAA